MKENRLLPKRRFKEFENDGAWEERKIGELANVGSAARVHKDEWVTSGVPFFRSSDVVAAYKSNENEKAFISFKLYEQLVKVSGKLEKNDILITGGGSIGIPYIVTNNKPLYSKDADLIWVKSSEKFNSRYLYTYFISPEFRTYLNGVSHIGTIAHYTIEQVKGTPIWLPSIGEQNEIASFFRNLDNLIALHQRKLKKLKETKSAYLSEMFPKEGEKYPKRRFDGFAEPWEQRKLNIFSEYQSSNYSANQFTDIKPTGNYPVFDANNQIASLNKYDQESAYISIIKDGAGVGRVELRPGKSSIIATMGYILPKQSDLYFIFTILQKINFTQFISGSTIPHVYYKDYGNAEFFIPTIKEQEKIGKFFNNLDNLITLHQRKLEKLENLKKAYLNEMFV